MSSEAVSAETNSVVFQLQNVYLKDASLEQPNSPAIFLEQQLPEIQIAINMSAEGIAEAVYEVQVTATVTAKIGEKVAYLVEAKQAGIFEIRQVPEEALDQVLSISCPSIVYPYLRANVADLILRSGFPAVHLAEINFEDYYHQRAIQEAEQAAQAGNASVQ